MLDLTEPLDRHSRMLQDEIRTLIKDSKTALKGGSNESFRFSFRLNSSEYYGASIKDLPELVDALKQEYPKASVACLLALCPWERVHDRNLRVEFLIINNNKDFLAESIAERASVVGFNHNRKLETTILINADGLEIRLPKIKNFNLASTNREHDFWTHEICVSETDRARDQRVESEHTEATSSVYINRIAQECVAGLNRAIHKEPKFLHHSASFYFQYPQYWNEIKQPLENAIGKFFPDRHLEVTLHQVTHAMITASLSRRNQGN